MGKQPVKLDWFSRLHTRNVHKNLNWLSQLCESVETIANFGCFSSEPFALLWTLDASEIKVVEKDEENLSKLMGPKEEIEFLRKKIPDSLEGRTVDFITADMTLPVAELLSNQFDLAYCENVLYDIHLEDGLQGVQNAINEMARVVKQGGWVIAVESKIGAKFEMIPTVIGPRPIRRSEPIDISPLFEAAGLERVSLSNAPRWSYCYIKPTD